MKLLYSMKIKDVTKNDLDEIIYLEEKIFGIDAFSEDLIRKLIKNKLLFIKIVDKTDKILGFSISIENAKNEANLINFLIREEEQNQGIGALLLKKTIDEIKGKKKFRSIVLNVKVDNDIAINLYKKFGFEIVKRIEGYYYSGASSIYMKLQL